LLGIMMMLMGRTSLMRLFWYILKDVGFVVVFKST
jgi:hypothetical protein